MAAGMLCEAGLTQPRMMRLEAAYLNLPTRGRGCGGKGVWRGNLLLRGIRLASGVHPPMIEGEDLLSS